MNSYICPSIASLNLRLQYSVTILTFSFVVALFDTSTVFAQTTPVVVDVPVSPFSMMWRQNGSRTSGTVLPTVINLANVGLLPGDIIRIEQTGGMKYGGGLPDNEGALVGVFSTSATILPETEIQRIPDAVDAGDDFDSGFAGLIDIPHDFLISAVFFRPVNVPIPDDRYGIEMSIPEDVGYLFVAAFDNIYPDNIDQGLGVRITFLSRPSLCSTPPSEICNNNFDDDQDGFVDCTDADCTGRSVCPVGEPICYPSMCNDGNECTQEACGANSACEYSLAPAGEVCGGGWGSCNNNGECESLAVRAHCALEGQIRSIQQAWSTPIEFQNNSSGEIHIYWLNSQGLRVEICGSPLQPGNVIREPSFVSNYYIVTDDSDQCLGIYEVNFQVSIVQIDFP